MDEQPSTRGSPEKPAGDLSLEELFEMFPDDRASMEWFEGNMWPNGRECPRCGYKYTCVAKHPEMPYFCSECKKCFSVKIGTIMEISKIGYRKWAVATHLIATRHNGISSVRLGKDLGTSQSAAWFLLRGLRESWRTILEPDLVSGPIEVDYACLGGREKNKHADKRGKRGKRRSWA